MIYLIFFIAHFSYLFAEENYNSIFQETLYVQPTPRVQLNFAYDINTDYVATEVVGLDTSGSGTVTQSNGMAQIRTGTTFNSRAVLASIDRLTYRAGQGLVGVFSAIYGTPDSNNLQVVGIGDFIDGFYFGYNGTTFSVLYRTNSTSIWFDQSNWNVDPMDGTGPSGITLNPLVGNVYKIQYHWLGFDQVKCYVANPETGEFILVHTLNFLNSITEPILSNGSAKLLAANINLGGNADITLQTACMMGSVQGKRSIANNSRFSLYSTGSTSLTNIRNIFTILNDFYYPHGTSNVNQTMIYPDLLTFYNSSTTNDFVIYLIVNANGINPTTVLSNNSVVLYSSSAATLTSGKTILALPVPRGQESYIVNLSDLDIRLAPGQTLSIAVQRIGSGNTTAHASLSWTEGL